MSACGPTCQPIRGCEMRSNPVTDVTRYRIGIDVGGTFTHAVALDADHLTLSGQAMVPTTHHAASGVAEGVVKVLHRLLAEAGISPAAVAFLAYSTTQVTNALLEGDVEPVGIVAVGGGLEGRRVRKETQIEGVELSPGRQMATFHTFVARESLDAERARAAVQEVAAAGARAIVAAEAFSVDDPAGEHLVMSAAQEAGLPATGTHEISGRYGLRMRTRTAVINASLLPKAIATADLTERAVRESGIEAPLMVVRSDGGVMSIEDMRRRPLLALLSGPAAGVAAALMYVRVSNGIFIEVGGTSTDITAIEQGRALLRTAQVGGHRLFLRTLDVRTIGVAGGSMPRLRGTSLLDVGPRSAHLAGLPYACFTPPEELRNSGDGPSPVLIAPMAADPDDYLALDLPAGGRAAITVTCAANAAGAVPSGEAAEGNEESASIAASTLGAATGTAPKEAARAMLAAAARKAAAAVHDLLDAREMSRETTELIGGGGGAGALVPSVAEQLGLPHRVAANAAVISAIGTALALVREVVERTVPEAREADLLQVRKEAVEAVIAAGADPESIVVEVEYDARTALLRATASGQTELRERDPAGGAASDQERLTAAAKFLRVPAAQVEPVGDSGPLRAYRGVRVQKCLLGLLTRRRSVVAVVDQQAVVRLLVPGATAGIAQASRLPATLSGLLVDHTHYGDAGAELPQAFLGVRGRIVNLSGLAKPEQVLSLAAVESAALAPQETVLVVVAPRR